MEKRIEKIVEAIEQLKKGVDRILTVQNMTKEEKSFMHWHITHHLETII